MNTVRSTEVTFRAAFDAPPGQRRVRLLADFIAQRIRSYGVACEEPRELTDALLLRSVVGQRGFQLHVQELDAVAQEWRVAIGSELSRIRRWLRATDEAEQLHLSRSLHKVLSADRLSDVRWRNTEAWARPHGEAWSERWRPSTRA